MSEGSGTDQPTAAVRLMTILGLIAAVVLIAAAAVLAVTWPTAPTRSSPVPVRLYAYDPSTGRIGSTPLSAFQQGQVPAAGIPADEVDEGPTGPVRATWYDALGYRTNSADFEDLTELSTAPVPLSTTSAVPAGDYQFVLEGLRDGKAVQVLAWVHVEIER